MPYWLLGLSALLVTALVTQLAKRPAHAIGLVDRPGGRKQHDATVPLCGGPALVIAFLVLVTVFEALPSERHLGLLGGVVLLALVGCWDDLRDLSARKRFAFQIFVTLLCLQWLGGEQLTSIGDLFGRGDIELGLAAIPFTVFCVVGLINAMNLIDGIDGLAGGLTVIALNCFAIAALGAERLGLFSLLVLLIGGTAGFLLFNLRTVWRRRASVFLGDSGSTVLGFVLCWFAVDLTQGRAPALAPITAVWILALPVMDTVSVMLSRALRGDRPFNPSREHLHHVVLALGYSPRHTVRILLVLGTMLAAIGLTGEHYRVDESLMCLGFIGLWLIYFCAMQRFWRRRYTVFVSGWADAQTRPSFREFIGGSHAGAPIIRPLNVTVLPSLPRDEHASHGAMRVHTGAFIADPDAADANGVVSRPRDNRVAQRANLG
jgi:UDP-GlcNAc:undecaprenyl-phosphate/decaprenyl-phosphate GlcNAc-1-phosphate transferase